MRYFSLICLLSSEISVFPQGIMVQAPQKLSGKIKNVGVHNLLRRVLRHNITAGDV